MPSKPAPQDSREMPPPLRPFVGRVREVAQSSASIAVLCAAAVMTLVGALGAGEWGMAAGAAGFIGFLTAVSLGSQLPVARRALGAGYVVKDLADALSTDLPLRREEPAFELGVDPHRLRRVAGLVRSGALGFTLLEAWWLAVRGLGDGVAQTTMAFGILTAFMAAFYGLLWDPPTSHAIAGRIWLRFWKSALGRWAARVAALGLGSPGTSRRSSSETPNARWGSYAKFDRRQDAREWIEKRIARIMARLDEPGTSQKDLGDAAQLLSQVERRLATLEALRVRLREPDPRVLGRICEEVAAARKLCEKVEPLLRLRLVGADSRRNGKPKERLTGPGRRRRRERP